MAGLKAYLATRLNMLAIQKSKMYGDWQVTLDADGDHLVYFNSEFPDEKLYSNPLLSCASLKRHMQQVNGETVRYLSSETAMKHDDREICSGSRWSREAISQVLCEAGRWQLTSAMEEQQFPGMPAPECTCDGCKACYFARFEDIFPDHRFLRVRQPVSYVSSLHQTLSFSESSSELDGSSEYKLPSSSSDSSEPIEECEEHVNSLSSSKYQSKNATEMSALSGLDSEGYDVFERGAMLYANEEMEEEALQAAFDQWKADRATARNARVKKEKTEYDDLMVFLNMLEKRHEQSCSWTVPVPGTAEYEHLCLRKCFTSHYL